jgi:hypothetical protein
VAYELRFPSFGVTSRRHGLQNGAHMSPKWQAYLEFVQGRDPRLGGLPICPYAKGGKYFIAEDTNLVVWKMSDAVDGLEAWGNVNCKRTPI